MRLGLWGARMDNSGLGIQTQEYFNHLNFARTQVIDMGGHNGNRQYPERYKASAGREVKFCDGLPNYGVIDEFLRDLDCILLAESPYNYQFYEEAKKRGIKTAVAYNYEFFDWFLYPHLPTPDMLIAPSKWHYEDINRWAQERGIHHTYLHCPVNRQKLPYHPNDSFKTFLHVAGRAAAHDRNGTMTVIECAKYLQSDAKILIHFQGQQGIGHQVTHTLDDYAAVVNEHNTKGNIIVRHEEIDDYQDIYNDGDVLVLPRRYGGNCLPMNEALSRGMPVLMPAISPNTEFLERSWLMAAQVKGQFAPRTVIDIYEVDPLVLAAKIDELATMPPAQASAHNQIANALAEKIDWQALKHDYLKTLEDLCAST